jgi:hypothetical protein
MRCVNDRRDDRTGGSSDGVSGKGVLSIVDLDLERRQTFLFFRTASRCLRVLRTGTTVTDEDQLERGRLSHLSFL